MMFGLRPLRMMLDHHQSHRMPRFAIMGRTAKTWEYLVHSDVRMMVDVFAFALAKIQYLDRNKRT